jgi:hypothetical protein
MTYGESKTIYPAEHIGTNLLPFIASTFIRDGVKCFYGVDGNNFSTSKSNITIDELKTIGEGNSLTRTVEKTGKTYLWKPISLKSTDTVEVSMECVGNLYCLDIDNCETIDGIKYGNYDWNNLPEIFKECPYTKSRNKGNPHIWFRIDGIDANKLKTGKWKNANSNINFADGEILTRMTWEYLNANVYNWNSYIPTLNWNDVQKYMKTDEVRKWNEQIGTKYPSKKTIFISPPKSPTTVIESVSDDEQKIMEINLKYKPKPKPHDINYNKIQEHANNISVDKFMTTGKYDFWKRIMWALRSLDDDDYKDIAITLAKKCGRDIDKYVTPYWNNYNFGKGVNIGTLLHYSKESNLIKYNELNIKYSSSVKQKIFKDLNLENMIKSACESDFATIFYNTFKHELVLNDKNIYVYYKNEWRIEPKNESNILLSLINDWTIEYLRCCFTYLGLQKAEAINNTDLLKEYAELDKTLMKTTQGIKRMNFCKNVSGFVKAKLATVFDKKIFDIGEEDHYNLHFKNGVYDIKNKIFRERCYYDYVTMFLNYDYIPSCNIDNKIKLFVEDFYKKIQPNAEQRRFTLEYLALCLTANMGHQKFKMNVGYTASNGKSTEIAIHEKVLPIYTKKLNKDTFVLGYSKRHKHIISLLNNPIRLAYVEELPEKKLDIEFVKDFVDGRKLECEVMFGTENISTIQAKLMTCSNNDFNGKTDEGIKRRGLIQHYQSKFLTDDGINVFDDDKHIYKKIKGYEEIFDDAMYKNAYIHLLLQYVNNFEPPKLNADKFEEICEENDTFKNKLFDEYNFTGLEEDKIYWKDIATLFGAVYGKEDRKMISNDMKRLNIQYNPNISFGRGKKGGYIGLKIHDEEEIIV